MKARGIWIAICLILALGFLSTSYTKQYISVTEGTQKQSRPISAQPDTLLSQHQPDESEPAPEHQTLKMGVDAFAEKVEGKNAYLKRLQELDEQLARDHSGGSDVTANSIKAAAENKRRLWESELNKILNALEAILDEEEKRTLFKQQNEWIKDRENKAVSTSKKQGFSVFEEVEYNISLADSIRSRAYELAEKYAALLSETE